jgi:uncharacterized protein YlxW (UPF0749 family)
MPLIDLITSGALDEEYVEVARRRGAGSGDGDAPGGSGGPRRPRPGLLGAVAVLVFAVLVTISFQQTRDNEDVSDAGRATLEDRIRTRREVVSRAQERIVDLRADNTRSDSALDALDAAASRSGARLERLRVDAGFASQTGEGVRIVVGDSPDGLAKHRVYDDDLALLANGLWRAGATAIAVNGQRLTAVSAFRFSGGTIRVNRVNLSPPYTVEALGDSRTLLADLLDTSTGLTFDARRDEFGFTFEMQNVDRLTLPAAPARIENSLRSAQPVPADPVLPVGPAGEEEDP